MHEFLHNLHSFWNSNRQTSRRRRRSGYGTEALESRLLLTVAPFQQTRLETGTPLQEFSSDEYQLALGDWNLDGQEDLFAMHVRDTSSGMVEVSVYSGATDFQTRILTNRVTAMPEVSGDWTFRVIQPNPAVRPDIAAFNPAASGGFVTVGIMPGSSTYSQHTQYATSLPTGSHWEFDMADYNNDGIQDVYGIEKHAATHTATVNVLSGVNQGLGKYKASLLVSQTPDDDSLDDSFEFRVRKWGPGDTVPDLVAIKRYAPDSFTADGFTFVWDYSGSSDYTFMRAAVVTELRNTPGNHYQWDVKDVQGSTTTHDGFPELVLFSTYQTGSGSSEVHLYTGEYLPSIDYVSLPEGSTIIEGQVIQPGQVIVNYRGEQITFLGTITGPDGAKAVFSNGSFTIGADIGVGQVAIQTTFSLLAGNTITAPQGVTVKTGDVAIATSFDGTVNGNFQIESGTLNGSPVINGNFVAGGLSGFVLLAVGGSPGTMIVQDLTLNSTVTFEEQLFGLPAGTGYDQIISSGLVTLNNPVLLPDVQFSVPAGSEFVVIRNDGLQAVVGNFVDQSSTALTEGAIVSNDIGGTGRTARISYRGGDGNDVVIVVDGNYTFTSPANGATNELRIVADDGLVKFFVDGTLTRTRLAAGLSQLIVQGEAGQVDNFKIDFAGVSLRCQEFAIA